MPTRKQLQLQLREKAENDWKRYIRAIDFQCKACIRTYSKNSTSGRADHILPSETHQDVILSMREIFQPVDREAIRKTLSTLPSAPQNDVIDVFVSEMLNHPAAAQVANYDAYVESIRDRLLRGLNALLQQVGGQISTQGSNKMHLPDSIRQNLEDELAYAKAYRDYLKNSKPKETQSPIAGREWDDLMRRTDDFLIEHGVESQNRRNTMGAYIMAPLYPTTWGAADTETAYNKFNNFFR